MQLVRCCSRKGILEVISFHSWKIALLNTSLICAQILTKELILDCRCVQSSSSASVQQRQESRAYKRRVRNQSQSSKFNSSLCIQNRYSLEGTGVNIMKEFRFLVFVIILIEVGIFACGLRVVYNRHTYRTMFIQLEREQQTYHSPDR